ncbi:hypothetical protein sos41_13570 [Alphaproteobacteria bacterium SO-S41]|nr:hypothetical protein sos41_13570 [Alphaproteobacteria bacterium SO-S41]
MRIVLAAALLVATLGIARADEPLPPPIDCGKDYETLYLQAYNIPDVAFTKNDRVEEVWTASRLDTYIFSREGTAAYPSIMLRSIRKTGKRSWGASMSGCGFGDQEAFQDLLEDYKDINRGLLNALTDGQTVGPP